MQTVTTTAIIALLSLLVVFGFFSVLRDLLDRFVESPLMPGSQADDEGSAKPLDYRYDLLREPSSEAGIECPQVRRR
jgi:hypothetical protein